MLYCINSPYIIELKLNNYDSNRTFPKLKSTVFYL